MTSTKRSTNARRAIAALFLGTLAMSAAVSSPNPHAVAAPTSGYEHIDATDHPTNPMRCASRPTLC